MIGLVLLAGLALADEPATYERLFGTEPAPAAASPEPEAVSPWRLAVPAVLGVIGVGALWRLRGGAPGLGETRQLQVLSRHPLGDRSALVLLEVIDADGERRRLLIGTGTGAPALVADLGQSAVRSVADDDLAERQATPFADELRRRGLPC